jgi:hypothetical protein
MMRFRNKLLLLFFLFFYCCASACAQDGDPSYIDSTGENEETGTRPEDYTTEQPRQKTAGYNKSVPTARQWQQLTSDKAFGYKTAREYVPDARPVAKPEIPWIVRFWWAIVTFFASLPGRILLSGLLAFIIVLVVYRILSGKGRIFARRDRTVKDADEPTGAVSEEDLLSANWEERLRAALTAGDMRMAIRYSYMYLLQLLQQRELIAYRQDKTNTDYYRELSGNAISRDFRQLSREYEYAWYGNFLPASPAFEAYMQIFNGVEKQIGTS